MSAAAIEVRGLRKTYGPVAAVDGIDLSVARGEVFALLGPNGAGKTTTVEILEGHRDRTSGDAVVLGHDPGRRERALKRRVGIVLQETGVEPYLTVTEAIELYRGYYPSPRSVDEVIELVGLQDKRASRVNRLSGGQKRRLDVAIGLAGDPELLFLDEPTTGFDPSARRTAWAMVGNLSALGKTVFLTTHYMDEAQHLAGRVAIIVGGRIVVEGTPSALGGRDTAATRVSFELPETAPALPAGFAAARVGDRSRVEIQTSEPLRLLHELTGWALDERVELRSLTVNRPSLEDVYLDLTRAAEDVRAEAASTTRPSSRRARRATKGRHE
jgi:ABC-2 type transport system ATP-binding protein